MYNERGRCSLYNKNFCSNFLFLVYTHKTHIQKHTMHTLVIKKAQENQWNNTEFSIYMVFDYILCFYIVSIYRWYIYVMFCSTLKLVCIMKVMFHIMFLRCFFFLLFYIPKPKNLHPSKHKPYLGISISMFFKQTINMNILDI